MTITTLKLSAPITAHGDPMTALNLRHATGRDIRECGLPYRLDSEGGIIIDSRAAHRMIAQLAAVPPSSIDQLSGPDWNNAAQAVLTMVAGQQVAAVEAALAEALGSAAGD
ncbi:phage tail assembly protein [Roseomonas frigidaquae]|uniref:Phage tail assembly protein n=1 Tax=Falsiroseomonas frigidaquae TaxID=487318 RepID=A0ABX1F852_9PROT|nr:phage tail assembly protein [Falsiroseomonas frigidaquae]NKE48430.1 phage tail assembly protein [Falsiroseomonas frigidaquae]